MLLLFKQNWLPLLFKLLIVKWECMLLVIQQCKAHYRVPRGVHLYNERSIRECIARSDVNYKTGSWINLKIFIWKNEFDFWQSAAVHWEVVCLR